MIREINTPFAVSIESLCLLLKVFVLIGLVKYVGNHSLYIKHFCFICILLMWILSLIPSCHREGEVGLSQNDQVGIDSLGLSGHRFSTIMSKVFRENRK